MKKLNLKLDDLQVETFATSDARRDRRGTVNGQIVPRISADCVYTSICVETDTCPATGLECTNDTSWQQCGYSFGGTCGASPPETAQFCGGGGELAGFAPYLCA
ncbi:MAG TPA: hypothetical protein VFE05_11105 [Longimicrobiaceae bacterium]|jgi:hypothetical protein|nr:hypothetical protein [Longimicrobiaceae bacterium]